MSKKMHYSWSVVIGCAIIMFSTMAGIGNTIGVFFTTINAERGFSMAQLGLYYTFQGITVTLTLPLVRKLFYKIDARAMAFIAVTLMSLGYALFAFWPAVWGWWVSGVIIGCGIGFVGFGMIPLLMNSWFKKKFTAAVGIAYAANGLGGFVFTLIIGRLIGAMGYQTTYIVIAVATFLISMPGVFLLRSKPADKDLFPYGISSAEELELANKKDDPLKMPGLMFKDALKRPVFWLMVVALLIMLFGCNLQTQMTNLAYSIGFSVANATVVSALVMLGNIPGRILIGALIDKFNAKVGYTYAGLCGVLSIVCFLLSGVSGAFVYIGAFLFGNFFPITAFGPSVLLPTVVGRKDYGTIQSYVATLSTIVGIFASTIFGAVYDASGTYATILYVFVIGLAVATLGVWLIWKICKKEEWNRK